MSADGFKVPKNGHAIRKSVATAINVAWIDGVKAVVQDPHLDDTVYIVCDRSTWNEILVRAAKHSGNERSGDRRSLLFCSPPNGSNQ